MKKKIVLTSVVLLASLALAGCGNNLSTKSENSSLKAENSSLKKSENVSIVGSYKDEQDGAAITLNSDGTGRYVYADKTNPDTDDQLTWKKDSNNSYTINLQDSNVSGPLTGTLEGSKLTLSGNSDWNTETFSKVKGNLNLDNFLAEEHGSSPNNSSKSSTNGNAKLPPATDIHDFINKYGVSPVLYKTQHFGMSDKEALDSTPDNMKTSGELQSQQQLDSQGE